MTKITDRLTVVFILITISFLTAKSQNNSTTENVFLTSNRSFQIFQNIMGQDINLSSTASISFDLTLKKSDKKITNISASVKHMILKGQVNSKEISFDSDKQEDLNGEFGSLIKETLNKVVDVGISGNQFFYKNDDTNQSDEIITTLLGEKIFSGFPEELIFEFNFKHVGDSISYFGNQSDTGTHRNIIYTLKSISKNDALVLFEGFETVKKTKKNNGVDAYTFVENKMIGHMILDTNSGIIKHREIEIKGNGKTETMNLSIPFKTKQIIISDSKK